MGLVQKVAQGGAEGRLAEAELCRRFAPRIELYGVRHLGDPERARDLVQMTLIGLLRAARERRIREGDKVAHFVLGTCRNTAIRLRDMDARLELKAPEDLPEIPVEMTEPLDLRDLMHCLQVLEDRARQVVYLSFTEGKSAGEIAKRLSTTSGNVRVVRHRAVSALRTCLEGVQP